MRSNLSAAQRKELARRNAEHQPVYWMQLTEAEAQQLAAGCVPEVVQSMAGWLTESVDEMLTRKASKRG